MTKKPSLLDIENTMDQEWLTLINDCEERESRLSDWERGFIDGLRDHLEVHYLPLTELQISTLNDIWERVTNNG